MAGLLVRKGLPWLVTGLLLAVPLRPMEAQGVPSSSDTLVFRIEGIQVKARRTLATPGGASAIEVSLDSLPLPAAATVEELFRKTPSLHVRKNSRGEAEVTLRGSESRQVAVLVDGVPLTLNWDARTDVSVLPSGAVTQLRLVRGLSSILYGPNTLGGVVEMGVARGLEVPEHSHLSAALGLDHKGGYGTSATGELPYHGLGGGGVVRFGAALRDSPGFPLAKGVREPVATDNDLRLNTDARNRSGFVALRHRTEGGAWGSFSAWGFQAERGIAAELEANNPRLWRYPNIERGIVAVSGGTGDRRTPLGRGDLEASVGIDRGRTEILSYADRQYRQVTGTEEGDARTWTVRLLGDHTLGPRGELRGSFTWSDIFHEATVNNTPAEYQQKLLSLAGETSWRLTGGKGGWLESLRLSFGGAWDRGETPKTGGLPALGTLDDWGARAGLTAVGRGGNMAWHAGVSRRGRFPSLREMYSEALARFEPNPDLRPEHLLAMESGMTLRVGNGELQTVLYHHQLDGAIRRITLPNRKRKRINADEIRSTGVEVFFSQSFRRLSLDGDMTLQKVELKDTASVSKEPENMPERVARLRAGWELGGGASLFAEADYLGDQFAQHPDTGADVLLEGAVVWNLGVRKDWRLPMASGMVRRLETALYVDNLSNTLRYDQFGLPQPGRLVRFEARVF